jgi:hypothetical protein
MLISCVQDSPQPQKLGTKTKVLQKLFINQISVISFLIFPRRVFN